MADSRCSPRLEHRRSFQPRRPRRKRRRISAHRHRMVPQRPRNRAGRGRAQATALFRGRVYGLRRICQRPTRRRSPLRLLVVFLRHHALSEARPQYHSCESRQLAAEKLPLVQRLRHIPPCMAYKHRADAYRQPRHLRGIAESWQ